MQRTFLLCLLLLPLSIVSLKAQTIEDASPFADIHAHTLRQNSRPASLTPIRESDVVWGSTIWRVLDLKEKFNQFFYFPTEKEGLHGRYNFAYTIWNAVVTGEIPIYEDDEMKIPIDNDAFVEKYTKADTVILEIVDDEDNYEYKSVVVPKEFRSEDILRLRLKEAWFIDKQANRQLIRYIGLALTQEMFKDRQGELEYMGTITLFWIPMQAESVRLLLEQHEAFYEDNIAHLPSWGNIFDTRRFDSYITRESNRFNRSISDYLTGVDAIIESDRIENKLLEISSDMWEY